MKNPVTLIIVVVVAMLGIGGFVLTQKSSTSDPMMKKDLVKEETMEKKADETMVEKSGNVMMDDKESMQYVEYSKSALDSAVGNRRVLFFYASWCPTCKPADADFTANSNTLPTDVTVVRVNYNDPETDQEEKDLAKKYGITYQHTFVQIDSQGTEVTKWNGGKTEELLANIK